MESNPEAFTQSHVNNGREQLYSIHGIIKDLIRNKAEMLLPVLRSKKIGLDTICTALKFIIGDKMYEGAHEIAMSKVREAMGTDNMDRIDMRKSKSDIDNTYNMSDAAAIYFKTSADYIITQISENAPYPTAHGYAIAVKNNTDLSDMFKLNNISFLSNTAVPYLSFGLYRKIKPDERYESEEDEDTDADKKPKIIGVVNQLQEAGDCIILPRSAVSRIVRDICHDFDPLTKVGMDMPIYLQYIVEQEMVDILRHASYVSYASKSTKLNTVDIDIAISIRENKLPASFN